jgi:hypothetical protein
LFNGFVLISENWRIFLVIGIFCAIVGITVLGLEKRIMALSKSVEELEK